MDAEERTARMIRYIDALVAAPKIPEKLKHFVLDEFNGQIVGGHSITLTGRRCLIADTKHDVEQTAAVTVIADFMHQLKGNDDSMRERLLLHRAIKRARQNGWNGGDTILDTIGDGRWFDTGELLRGLLAFDDFLAALWQGENLAKHRLGLTLFEDPLTYVRLYV